jgi:hypothetical protein
VDNLVNLSSSDLEVQSTRKIGDFLAQFAQISFHLRQFKGVDNRYDRLLIIPIHWQSVRDVAPGSSRSLHLVPQGENLFESASTASVLSGGKREW